MRTRISLLCLFALMLAACSFTGDDKSGGPTPLKEDISNIKNPSEDYCDLYDWYGDGECDEFCTQPDPDCNMQCDAFPACDANEIQVDSCEGLQDCEEVSICGNTIYCQADQVSCLTIAPTCGPGEEPVNQCDTDDERCTLYSDGCGADLYCWKEVDTCDAIPVCPDSTREVQVCNDDTLCHVVSMCGESILCQQDISHCEAYPSCPEGTVEVETCPADASCFDEYLCGYGITCMEEVACRALPVCDQGHVEVDECPADTSCYERSACGETITCAEYGATCLALPVCGPGSYQVSNEECAASRSTCERESICGLTIFCKDMPLYCDTSVGQPPSCPANTTEVSSCTQDQLENGTCFAVFGTGDQCASQIYCQQ